MLFIEEDFSRFIPGCAMAPAESAEPVIKCFEDSVHRYGRPEGAMSDLDQWAGSLERFCTLSEVPYPTLEGWKRKDAVQTYIPAPKRPIPPIDSKICDIARMLIEDYARWQGSLAIF